ncbi:MAG: AAA family ATPase [Chloroflexota bacterium]|nr:AAA family ATPase [Chloroflexota bacterium]
MSESHLGSPVATYVYRDEHGWPLYRVDRFEPKTFRVHRPVEHDSGGTCWESGLSDARRVLYRLNELVHAPSERLIYVCEGEKDADALHMEGQYATTNVGGAGNWREEYNMTLAERHVVILPDNDDAGRAHAERLVDELRGHAATISVVQLPGLPDKGDVSDWLAAGGTVAELEVLAWDSAIAEQAAPERSGSRLITRNLADVVPEEVTWLWKGWLPRGKLSLVGGHPGDGKSTLTTAMAAILSTSGTWPDGSQAPQGGTLFLLAEDSLGDTVRPRLDQHGANLLRIEAIEAVRQADGSERAFTLSEHLAELEQRMAEQGTALLVIDPLSAFLTARNRNDDGDIRDVLTPLGKLAERCNVAILGVMHVGKPGAVRRTALQSFMGSTAFGAVARQAMMVHPIPDSDHKLLAVVKSNVAIKPPALEWSRPQDSAIIWHGESEYDIESLLGGGGSSGPGQRDIAGAFLNEVLANGPLPSREFQAGARGRGISPTTLQRESASAGLTHRKVGRGRDAPWYTGLPDTDWIAFSNQMTSRDGEDTAGVLCPNPCE